MSQSCPIHQNQYEDKCYVCRVLSGKEQVKPSTAIFQPRKEIEWEAPCIYLGDALNLLQLEQRGFDTKACGCTGKIRFCEIHTICTTGEKRDKIACCSGCKEKVID